MKDRRAFVIVCVILLIIGAWIVFQSPESKSDSGQATVQTQDIAYQGVDGRTALDILKENYQVETTSSDLGEYVVSINGISPDNNQFWAFYINDQASQEGAGSYQTKSTDILTWKLENVQ